MPDDNFLVLDGGLDGISEAIVGALTLTNVHPMEQCAGQVCVVHNPTDHRMRGWPLVWRNDRKIFERRCPHGIGHPDPDQRDYWRATGRTSEGMHGCDGCCRDTS